MTFSVVLRVERSENETALESFTICESSRKKVFGYLELSSQFHYVGTDLNPDCSWDAETFSLDKLTKVPVHGEREVYLNRKNSGLMVYTGQASVKDSDSENVEAPPSKRLMVIDVSINNLDKERDASRLNSALRDVSLNSTDQNEAGEIESSDSQRPKIVYDCYMQDDEEDLLSDEEDDGTITSDSDEVESSGEESEPNAIEPASVSSRIRCRKYVCWGSDVDYDYDDTQTA